MKSKRAILVEPKKFEIIEDDVSLPRGKVLAKVESCGLCNFELNFWKGLMGTYPRTLGHEWSGTIVEIGADVKTLKVNDRITILPSGEDTMMGYSEYATISERKCLKVHSGIDLKYALGEPLKCIVTVLRAVASEAGDNGVVLGCGPMGLWCLQALSGKLLSTLVAIDINESRLKLAKKFGATHTINSRTENVQQRLAEITKGHLADFVVEGTGVPTVLNEAQKYLRSERGMPGRGRLVLMSSHGSASKDFDFREAISRGLQILVPHAEYSSHQIDDLRRALLLLENETFKVREIVTHEFKLDDIQRAFETLENKPDDYLKGIVVP